MIKHIITTCLFSVIFLMSTTAQSNFPQSWIGTHKGTVEIYSIDSVAMTVEMTLDIQPTAKDSTHTWVITYEFDGNVDERKYEIVLKNKEAGWYQIDEKNSILIDGFYHNGYFTSCFEVMGSFIISSYYKGAKDEIVFEIIAGKTKVMSTTGNTKQGEEDIPEVKSYPVTSRQKGVLKLMK